MTNFRKVAWGMEGIFFVLTFLAIEAVALSKEVLGGPTQPNPVKVETRQEPGLGFALQEVSPQILDIKVKKGDPFIEVYIRGSGYLDCYDAREYDVDRDNSKTLIVPRLKRTKPGTTCAPKLKEFEDKVADLDPTLDSSYSLEILGYKGWYKKQLPR